MVHGSSAPPAWFAVLHHAFGAFACALVSVGLLVSWWLSSLLVEGHVVGGGAVVVGELLSDVDGSVLAGVAAYPDCGGLFSVDAVDGAGDEVFDLVVFC